jgi:hypothetical protein
VRSLRPNNNGLGGVSDLATPTTEVLAALVRFGLLLKQDKRLPSVVTILAGEPLSTSWWSHPKNHLIFHVLSELADHPDILFTKLLFAKDTLVHRSLWPAFLAVATSGEPWQMDKLSTAARRLLRRTMQAKAPVTSAGAPIKELVSRLLVHAVEVHTAGGRHQVAAGSWDSWAAQAGVTPLRSLSQAREELEAASRDLDAPLSALPWRSARIAIASVRGERDR